MIDELKQWEYDKGYDRGYEDSMTVLDKIRTEIETKYGGCSICTWDGTWYQVGDIVDILHIIDLCKSESEESDK